MAQLTAATHRARQDRRFVVKALWRNNPWFTVQLVVLVSCTGPGRGSNISPDNVADSDVDAAIESLRFRVASDNSDLDAHRRLARLELRARRPGAALRHFEVARRNNDLNDADRRALARLRADRFRARLDRGDGAAYRDAEAVSVLDADRLPSRQQRAEARFLAALVALRRGNQWGERAAAEHLAAAASLAPSDPRVAVKAPERAALADVGRAALWLHDGGALRVSRRLLELYFSRGGRQSRVLRALVASRLWWGDENADFVFRRQLAGAGVSACAFASLPVLASSPSQPHTVSRRASGPGCAGTLWSVATGDGDFARLVRQRAVIDAWRTSDPGDAAAWALLLLRTWLAGQGSWSSELGRRVDIASVASSSNLPLFAAPTFLRLAGRAEDSARALDRVLATMLPGRRPASDVVEDGAAGAGSPSALGRQLLIAAEAALARRPAPVVAALTAVASPAPSALVDDLWLVGALHTRSVGDRKRLADILSRAPNRHARDRFRRRDPDTVLAAPRSRAEIQALAEIATAHLYDPAVADRQAGDFVDGDPDIGRRGPMVAALFAALGDVARAHLWWRRIAAQNPREPHGAFELGAALCAAGDPVAAEVHFTAAAATSGDAGTSSLRAARVLVAHGHALEAIAWARRALALTAPMRRPAVYRVLAEAMTMLGRHREAATMRRHAAGQAGAEPPERTTDNRPTAATGQTDMLDPGDASAVLASIRQTENRDRVHKALFWAIAWNPDDERLYAELARVAPRPSWTRDYSLAALLVLALGPTLDPPGSDQPGAFRDSAAASDRARRARRALQAALRGQKEDVPRLIRFFAQRGALRPQQIAR
ncbi:MAG: hypothetical protein MJE77_10325 [Proteobacteria bacterium]|nr:hypothetical protein [Pseudomonadota bacterium]